MTAQNEDDLMRALAAELESMSGDSAERLCSILRGLFTCIQDLNQRLGALEGDATLSDLGEDRSPK